MLPRVDFAHLIVWQIDWFQIVDDELCDWSTIREDMTRENSYFTSNYITVKL